MVPNFKGLAGAIVVLGILVIVLAIALVVAIIL